MKNILILTMIIIISISIQGCSQKDIITKTLIKKEFVYVDKCVINLDKEIFKTTKIELPVLKNNSKEELNKVKKYILNLLSKNKELENNLKAIEEIYTNYEICQNKTLEK